MPARHRAPHTRGRSHHAESHKRRSLSRGVALGLTAVIIFSGSAAGFVYQSLQLDSDKVSDLVGERGRPTSRAATSQNKTPGDPFAGQAVNIYVVGSDYRGGDNGAIANDDTEGMRADVQMIAHISANRDRVDMVSIQRDTLVDIPQCSLPDGQVVGPEYGAKFNNAFANGGLSDDPKYAMACGWKAVENISGVRIDASILVDFAGFQSMVDALGGVKVDLPSAISDPEADLYVNAGPQVLNGHQALGYARVRKSLGDGSDTQRVVRQQRLMLAIFDEALKKNYLSDAPSLLRFLQAATNNLRVSDQLGSIQDMTGFGYSLRHINSKNLHFLTAPVATAGDGANMVFTDETQLVWDALANDKPIPKVSQPVADPSEVDRPMAGG